MVGTLIPGSAASIIRHTRKLHRIDRVASDVITTTSAYSSNDAQGSRDNAVDADENSQQSIVYGEWCSMCVRVRVRVSMLARMLAYAYWLVLCHRNVCKSYINYKMTQILWHTRRLVAAARMQSAFLARIRLTSYKTMA